MGLYQPRNLTPYLQCIEANIEQTFSCQINGTKCTGYKLDIYSENEQLVYTTGNNKINLETPLYNGDIFTYTLPINTLTTGQDYRWKIRLYQEASTMLMGYGTTTGYKNDSIAIYPPTDAEKETIRNIKNKHLRIGSYTRAVSSYDGTLNRFTMAEAFPENHVPGDGTTVQVLDSDEDGNPKSVIYTGKLVDCTTNTLCMKPNTYTKPGHILKIGTGGQRVTVTDFNEETWVATYTPALPGYRFGWGTEYEVYSDFIDSNPDAPFYVRNAPNLYIKNMPYNLVARKYTFEGDYSQSENVELKWHKWKIWTVDEDNKMTLVDETEEQYSLNMSYTFEEFRNGLTYKIQLLIEDAYGRTFSYPTDMELQNSAGFTVNYDTSTVALKPTATFLPEKAAINVSWGNPVTFLIGLSASYTTNYYSDGTYTRSDMPNKVFSISTNEVVSTTVSATAILVNTTAEYEREVVEDTPRMGLKSLRLASEQSMHTGFDWSREEDRGTIDIPETFCISWSQKFDVNYEGDIINFSREDEEGVMHTYRVWIPPETDLQNKYKFLYDLDGVTGEYVWDNIAQRFCLQATSQINTANDYIFAETLNNVEQQWEDSKYFIENGTRGKRLNSYWWKFSLTKDEIIIQKGSD